MWTLSFKKVLCKHQRSQAALQCLMSVGRFPLNVVVHTGVHEEGGSLYPFYRKSLPGLWSQSKTKSQPRVKPVWRASCSSTGFLSTFSHPPHPNLYSRSPGNPRPHGSHLSLPLPKPDALALHSARHCGPACLGVWQSQVSTSGTGAGAQETSVRLGQRYA